MTLQTRRAILAGGAMAGVLDLLWALSVGMLQGRPPVRILHSIASGLLGKAAFQSGWPIAALGVLLHFTIAIVVCSIYYLLSRRIHFLWSKPLLAAPLFGVGVYLVMYRIVVPLSAAPWKFTYTPTNVLLALVAHVFCVALPIAWAVHRWGAPPVTARPPAAAA